MQCIEDASAVTNFAGTGMLGLLKPSTHPRKHDWPWGTAAGGVRDRDRDRDRVRVRVRNRASAGRTNASHGGVVLRSSARHVTHFLLRNRPW